MLIIDQLKEFSSLSQSEKAVANKLIELQDKIEDISIRELAKLSFVSTSAITRLSHKLGYDGYNDFKKKYLEEIKYENSYFSELDANFPFQKNDNLAKVVASISELYQETAKDTLELVDYYALIKAVKLIEEAKNVYVLSVGSSIDIGRIFAERMLRIGKNVEATENVNYQYFQAYHSTSEDCFIVISYSGTVHRTHKIIQYVDAITRNKAKLILITGLGQTELKKVADVVLTMTTRDKLYSNIAPYSSTVSTMMIMDMLYSAYFQKKFDKYLECKRQVARDYEPNRMASHKAMAEDENIVFNQ